MAIYFSSQGVGDIFLFAAQLHTAHEGAELRTNYMNCGGHVMTPVIMKLLVC
jgi:hypothetical protein